MPSVSITGNDSVIWTDENNPGGLPLTDFGDGDVMTIDWGADIQTTKVGKNGNVISARNSEGDLADVVIKVLRGSPDDIMLNAVEASYLADPAGFGPNMPTITATKRVGNAQAVVNDVYNLAFVIPKRHVNVKENVSGDTDQALAVHTYTAVCNANNSPRSIG